MTGNTPAAVLKLQGLAENCRLAGHSEAYNALNVGARLVQKAFERLTVEKTFRDELAIAALMCCRNHSDEKWLAERAYKIADAMLAAREVPPCE
jgi:hypothetical protein